MNFLKYIFLIASTVLLSDGVEAGIISVGSLQTSNSLHFIIDTKSGKKYSKLDKNLGLTYAELLSELSDTTSNWYGWKIATSEDNDNFLNAIFSFSGGSQCFGIVPQNSYCGTVSGWTDGMLGLNFISYYDILLYKRTIDSTNSNPFFFGQSIIEHNGEVRKADDSMHLSIYDRYFSHPVDGISILLVNDSKIISEPSSVSIFLTLIFVLVISTKMFSARLLKHMNKVCPVSCRSLHLDV